MRLLGKTAIVVGMAGAMALGSMTASQARFRAGPAIAAGVAGFALGAAAANANGYYYGSGYGYDNYAYQPGYSGYAYEPAYEPAYTSPSYYGPDYRYYNSHNRQWRDRQIQGRDW